MYNINVTFLSNFFDQEPIELSLDKVKDIARNDEKVKQLTEGYKSNKQLCANDSLSGSQISQAKKTAQKLKSSLPVVIPGAKCQGGKKRENITQLNAVMGVDIDKQPADKLGCIMKMLEEDEHTALVAYSPSYLGIRAFIPISGVEELQKLWDDSSKSARTKVYEYAYKQLADYILKVTGVQVDMNCSNPEHAFTIGHDPDCYFNPKAVPFPIDMSGYEQPKRGRKKTKGADKQSAACSFEEVKGRVMDILAKDGCTPEAGRNDFLHKFASLCNQYGADKDDVEQWALLDMLEDDFDESEILSAINSAYKYEDQHGTKCANNGKTRYCTVDELEEAISDYGDFRYNDVKLEYEVKPAGASAYRARTDEDENEIYRRVLSDGRLTTTNQVRTIIQSHFAPHYHPFREYLESLPECVVTPTGACQIEGRDEQKDYIAEFASRVTVEGSQDEFCHYFRIWFVSMVKSMGFENEVNQCALGLFGEQGIYKTTFFQMLLPAELRKDYFYLKTNSTRFDKDDRLKMAANALFCMEEMDTMSGAEMNQLKAHFTMRTIDERPAFGRNVVHMPRRVTFCMTGNEPQFLNDHTGSRRFFPFKVIKIEDPRTFTDYEALYAQAWALAQPDSGFRSYVSREEISALHERNKEFMAPVIEHDLIDKYLDKGENSLDGVWESAGAIKVSLEKETRERLDSRKIASHLRKLGYKEHRFRDNIKFHVVHLSWEQVQKKLRANPDGALADDIDSDDII